jgi:DNA-binding NarL/FixJ family response regulator
MIKVYIVDDHSVVIEGIKSVLQNESTFEVIGFATSAEKCLQFFENHVADVILIMQNHHTKSFKNKSYRIEHF